MAKDRAADGGRELDEVVSVVGPGMKIVGDCSSDGTIRVEGRIEGSVRAGKSVVVGAEGVVLGNVATQDAIIAGHVNGSITAESRVELQSSCRVEGDIRSRRVKLDEGGHVDGKLHMGGAAAGEGSAAKATPTAATSGGRAGADGTGGGAGSSRSGDDRPAAGSTSTGGSASDRSAAEAGAATGAASGDKAGDKGSDKASAGGGEKAATSGSTRPAAALKETRSR